MNITKSLIRLGNSSYALDLQDSHSSYLAGLSGGLGIKAGNWNIDLGFYNLETAGIVSGISLTYKIKKPSIKRGLF